MLSPKPKRRRSILGFVLLGLLFLFPAAGAHVAAQSVGANIVINEIMQNPSAVSDSSGEWFELYNASTVDVDINGWTIRDDDFDSHVINNGGPLIIPAGGYLVLGNNPDPATNGGVTVHYSYGSGWFLSNSADEVVLVDPSGLEVDRVAYDGGPTFPDPTGASMSLIDPALDNNVGSNWCTASTPYGSGDKGTPGAANDCSGGGGGPVFGACGDPATPISTIQGSGFSSPEVGNVHVIEGIVTGDFQNPANSLGGFFIQEESTDEDGNPATSEGLFVFDDGFGVDVMPGDLVRVQGTVAEFFNLTELDNVTNVAICANNQSVAATNVSLPVADLGNWEPLEGMLLTFPQTLYVTDNFNQGRYGEVELSVGNRLFNPTNVEEPGPAALALQDLNDRSRIQLDDASRIQNPLTLPYFEEDNTLRAGDTIANLTGVLGYSFGSYEIQPTQPVDFTRANPRPPAPADVGGSLKVASMNVLNYFTTLDNGQPICGPQGDQRCRGADNAFEFERQRAKILAALSTMNADVVGLIELENNANASIADLVSGLNDILGAGSYAYIDTGTIGGDAIKVGLIYKPAAVTPFGSYAILDSTVDPRFIDTKNRPVLAQTFQENASGELFTVAVNHLKSKGSPCDDVGDPNANDGQGNCNGTRTLAAQALVDWLAGDPTGSGDPDFLIIGDLNAYTKEDPVDAIKAGPDDTANSADDYTELVEQFVGPDAYSFTFFGQAGLLDHAFASSALLRQVTGASEWHINADEPRALDYNDFNQPSLYQPDPYRSSDHDPVVVGLHLDSVTTITIVKDAQPDSKRKFRFEGDLGKFKLRDRGEDEDEDEHGHEDEHEKTPSSRTFIVEPGAYTIEEEKARPWVLSDIVCDPAANATADLEERSVTVNVALGEDVTCTFVNQIPSYVLAYKYLDRNEDGHWNWERGLRNWEIQLYDASGALVDSETTNGRGKALFRRVTPGDYRVCEVQRSGWTNGQPGVIDPEIGQPCYAITIGPAQVWVVPFGNHHGQGRAAAVQAQLDGLTVSSLSGAFDEEGNANDGAIEAEQWLETPLESHEIFLPTLHN